MNGQDKERDKSDRAWAASVEVVDDYASWRRHMAILTMRRLIQIAAFAWGLAAPPLIYLLINERYSPAILLWNLSIPLMLLILGYVVRPALAHLDRLLCLAVAAAISVPITHMLAWVDLYDTILPAALALPMIAISIVPVSLLTQTLAQALIIGYAVLVRVLDPTAGTLAMADAQVLIVLIALALASNIVSYFGRQQQYRQYRVRRQLRALAERLQLQVGLDTLTGLANRGRFDEVLRAEWQRTQRHGGPLALVLLDIDDFKAYNDHYGHPAGDEALRRVASTLLGGLKRPTDLVARYGGEEFAVVLPDVDARGAAMLAERLRARVRALAIPHAASRTGPVLTISCGVAATRPDTDNGALARLVADADSALYQAKRAGRDRCITRETD